MLSWLVRNRLAAFERKYDYDVTYAREILAADRRAFLTFARLSGLGAYRRDVPRDVYWAAMIGGDVSAISQLLAADAVFYSDGGGKRRAALNPIYGRDKILRFLVGVAGKRGGPLDPAALRRAWINGMPGFVLHSPDGIETIAVEVEGGAIAAIYAVRNPDKLRHLS